MAETPRTILYAVIAAVSVGGALATHYSNQPTDISGVEGLGEPFFADFDDSTTAKSLHVIGFNEELATVSEFKVEQKESGQWVIPSHHDYPADAEDQLNKTASSVIGIARGALASRYEADHERLGVIDPEDEDGSKLKGRGQRITLTDADGTVLTDLIIGSKVEGRQAENGDYYHVRIPGEKSTYLANLDISLSTKFSDWIEDDLLKLDAFNLVDLTVNKYSIDEQRGPVDQEISHLSREKSSDPWALEDLKEDSEELLKDDISTMVSTLDNLKIMGVRPKPPGINADLTIDQKVVKTRGQLSALQIDLQARGFPIFQVGEEPQLLSNEGELFAATNEGIVYTLRFGEVFAGSQLEIETGFATKDDDKSDKKEKKDDAKEGNDASNDNSEGTESSSDKISRYIFVSAAFDAKYLSDKPPEEPAAPPTFEDATKEGDAKEGAAKDGDAKDGDAKDGDAKDGDAKDGDAKDGEKAAGEAAAKEGDDQDAAAADANKENGEDTGADAAAENTEPDPNADEKKKYEEELQAYKIKLAEYNGTIEKKKEKAKELNDRFAKWYYVISADDFEKLRLSRATLVKEKEKADPKEGTDGTTPIGPSIPGAPEKTADPKPADPKAADPKSVDAKPAETKAADPKPAETKPADAKPTEKPADTAKEDAKPAKPEATEPKKADPAPKKPEASKEPAAKEAEKQPEPKPADPPEQTEPAKEAPAEETPAKPAGGSEAAEGAEKK